MKSFTLVLTATFDFCDDDGVNDVGLKWSSTDGKALSDAPTELEPVIAELMRHSNYALPILSPLFEEFSQNNEPVTATASVKLKREKEHLILSFPEVEEKMENEYLRTFLFKLLTDRKVFLREVKELEKKWY
ncbi:hypothetical protein [Avibacterium paragallinarum]|uniref:Uncharacterized protein n=1 Tax=Avibacterium paragallinarum TaxID=728 RepID=A0ABU7QLX2_AVIPA|nr:hypothetical protein [Avibacterium paragallinarum]QZP16151.1 hypothetical protein K5O18_01950 [Avibacterium paragallinarum]WAL56707.1 hypothetical protein OY678_12440 [Avibacterium paragallinarum]WAM59226.1 hypothetical protein OW731_12125 [Avibacterium paragallinarum]